MGPLCVVLTSGICLFQICSICGITQTPVWRRVNKALVCNACGLKRRRSAAVSRHSKKSEAMLEPEMGPLMAPPAVTQPLQIVSLPKEESQQLEE